MKPRLRSLLLYVLIVLCALYGRPTCAEGPAPITSLPLVPLEKPDTIEMVAYRAWAELDCAGESCTLQVRQSYLLANSDQQQAVHVRVALPASDSASMEGLPVLTDASGSEVAPLAASPDQQASWELELAPGARATWVLTTPPQTISQHLLAWQLDMALLAPWGTIEGARVELHLPEVSSDDIFMEIEPNVFRFDGQTVTWDDEALTAPQLHRVVLFSPATWRDLQQLRRSGRHRELAALYEAIADEARTTDVDLPDLYPEIEGELQAAVAAAPQDVAVHQDLVALYRQRADQLPEQRLNYLLLAADELVRIVSLQPSDGEAATALAQTYYEVALLAEDQSSPAMALEYLDKAAQVPGAALGELDVARRELALRWAVQLAQEGLVSEALARAQDVLSPEAQDALLRYAPPIEWLQTQVALTPGTRVVTYTLSLYPSLAQQTGARLQDLSKALQQLDGVATHLHIGQDRAELSVGVSWSTPAELNARARIIADLLASDTDLVAAALAVPWQAELRSFAVEETFWRARYSYSEWVDPTSLQAVWEERYAYIQWHLVELQSNMPDDELEQLEQQLVVFAGREQQQVWKHLPAGTRWDYQIDYGGASQMPTAPRWSVAWGQAQELHWVHDSYHWPVISRLALIAGAILLLILVAVLWWHR